MVGRDFLVDLDQIDTDKILADIDEIRRCNPQRFEMEQLTAILHVDEAEHLCVGYRDIGPDEFWVRGHMPGMPLMPGVIMCEVAAQLSSYYARSRSLLGNNTVGLGGLEDVRFRGPVLPGDRLIMAAKLIKLRPSSLIVCRFQGFVNKKLVVEGTIKGIPLSPDSTAPR